MTVGNGLPKNIGLGVRMKDIKRGMLFHSRNGSLWVITKVNKRKNRVYYRRVKGQTMALPTAEFEEYIRKQKKEE